MDYIFLILSVVGFAGQFIITKLYEKNVKQSLTSSLVFFVILSLVNAAVCFGIGFFKRGFDFSANWFSIAVSAAMAVVMLIYQVVSIKILSLGNVGIYSMFMMLGGMALPFVYGLIFDPENNVLTPAKLIGMILLSVFLVLQVWGEKTNKKTKVLFYALCFVMFFINGMTGVLTAIHQGNRALGVDSESYIITYSLISVVIGVIPLAFMLLSGKEKAERRESFSEALGFKGLGSTVLCALVSTAANYFLVIAALTIPETVQFPVISGGTIVLTAIAAFLFYKEKPDKKGIVCIIGAFVSTVMFMF